MNLFSFIQLQTKLAEKTTGDWTILILIQIVLIALFVFMISAICKKVKPIEGEPSPKKTCIIISIMTFLAYIVMALIIWEVAEAQLLGTAINGSMI